MSLKKFLSLSLFFALLNYMLFIVHLRWPHVPHEPTSMKTTYLWISYLGPQEVGHEGVATKFLTLHFATSNRRSTGHFCDE